MQGSELSVTICSWNTRDDTARCLQSLQATLAGFAAEVIVVDNASTDGSPDMIATDFPWVKLIRLAQNIGFGAGHNRAFEASAGAFLMALNSDTIAHDGALVSLIEFMQLEPQIGIAGPKLLNPDGSLQFSCRRFPTAIAALFRNTPLGKLFPKNRFTREYLMLDWPHDKPRDVDWVSGAALCMRRELYESIGGFDERFFMYLEDVDLCYRAWQAGYRVAYFPQSVITHAIGRSTDKVANQMIRQFHHSMLLFYRKQYLPNVPWLLRPLALASAKLMLFARGSMFIAKNELDAIKRRLRRK